MPKRIFFISSYKGSQLGGGEKWNINIAKALAEKGYAISLLVRKGSNLIPHFNAFSDHIEEVDFAFDFNPRAILKLYQIFKRYQADTIVCNFNKDLSIAGPAARLARVKQVFFRNGFPILEDKFKHRLLNPFFDRIITNSSQIVAQYAEYSSDLEERITLIHNGLKLAEKAPKIELKFDRKKAIRILGAGRLSSVKRFDLFIKIIQKLQEDFRVDARIAGEGEELENLKKLDATYKTKINFLGYVEDMDEELKNCDVLLHSSSNEGLPNVVMEAMYYGKIVCVADSGGIRDLVKNGESGFLFQEETALDLAKCIDRCFDQEFTERMAKKAQKEIYEHFDFTKSFNKIVDLIEGK